jgi:hypothetical protein
LWNFIEHVVGTSKNKGLKPLYNLTQPLQKVKIPTQQQRGTIRGWICARGCSKTGQKCGIWGKLVYEKMRKKWRNGGDGNERRAGGGDGRQHGDVWWMVGGVVVVKWLVGEVGNVGKDRKMGRGYTT